MPQIRDDLTAFRDTVAALTPTKTLLDHISNQARYLSAPAIAEMTGRVLAALGTTSAVFDPADVDVAMNGVWVCRQGGVGDDRAAVDLSPRQVDITVRLGAGTASATILANDLTASYVHENSAYST